MTGSWCYHHLPLFIDRTQQGFMDLCIAIGRDVTAARSSLCFLGFFPLHLVICTLASMASPQCLTHSSAPSEPFLLQTYDREWSKGSSSPPLKESSFPSPVLRTCVPKKENLCKKKMDGEMSLGEGQEGKKTKCDDITLPFLHALELLPACSAFCRTPCSVQHGAASPSTECHWPPFSSREEQEMAVLPVSPAESSANELKNVFKQSFKFTGAITRLWEQQHKRREDERWQWFLFFWTLVLLIFM